MPKTKPFDCVEMKREIQSFLLARYQGLSEEEIRSDQESRIQENPILGPIYRRLKARTAERSRRDLK